MITSISAPITQNVGQPQNIVQPTSSSGETWDPLDSSRPTYPQNSYKPVLSQKETNDVNPISLESSSSLSTWMVWIESLDSDKYEYNVIEPIMIDVELKRGNDMLTVVWVGTLILEVFNSAMIQVYTESNVVWLAHGGAVTYYSYNFNLNETGKHLVRATLTWTDGTVTDVKEIEINIIEEQQNQPPIADAGPDQTVKEGDTVQFIGSGSNNTGTTWEKTTVDNGNDVGRYTSVVLDSNDYPHISYYDATAKALKYARWTGSAWSIKTLDSAGYVGLYTSIALDGNDYPHICYYISSPIHDLKYARWTGSAWSIETVESSGYVGLYTSIALDSNDRPHISYYGNALKYARWTGSVWNIETVDNIGDVGWDTSIALDSNDYPHISYYDSSNDDLKYVRWVGSAWSIGTVDSSGDVGEDTSIALDSNDIPHISYYDDSNHEIKYARWNGINWGIETIDTTDYGTHTSIALDNNNHVHISYYDSTNLDLKYTVRTGSSWSIETVDAAGSVGYFPSLTLDSEGNPHISYYNGSAYNCNLKYANKVGGITSYKWDFDINVDSDGDGDTTNDIDATGPTPTHVYGDDGIYTVTLRLTVNDKLSAIDTCNITVQNVDPSVTIESISMNVEIGLRVAGRKYNNVSMMLFEDGNSIGYVSIERMPGSPDEQMVWIPVSINFSRSYSAIVKYIPVDPPYIGGNPVWIYIKSQNGSINKIHHNFNVQQSKKRDSEHWNHVEPWEVDLNEHFIGLPFEITSHIMDPGSDDEILTITYGSQVKNVTYLNNPPNPDPYPSPKVNPRDIMDTIILIYEGPGSLILTVVDDDGGICFVIMDIG
jgi:hypothetical protein